MPIDALTALFAQKPLVGEPVVKYPINPLGDGVFDNTAIGQVNPDDPKRYQNAPTVAAATMFDSNPDRLKVRIADARSFDCYKVTIRPYNLVDMDVFVTAESQYTAPDVVGAELPNPSKAQWVPWAAQNGGELRRAGIEHLAIAAVPWRYDPVTDSFHAPLA